MIKEFIIPKVNPESAIVRAVGYLEALPAGKSWLVSIKPYKSNRTLDQNRTYWMWLSEISAATGATIDDLHDLCRLQFLPRHIAKVKDYAVEVAMSTTALSIDEMSAYMERIQQLAAELGIILTHSEGV